MSKLSIGTMLTSVLMTVAGKLIAALGIGAITYAGLDIIQRKFIRQALAGWNALPSDALQILLIGGVGTALNWVFGAVAFVVTYRSVSKLGTIMKGK